MAGYQEDTGHRLIAERLQSALQPLSPSKKLAVTYVVRDDILTPDEHHVVVTRTLFGLHLPLIFGKVVCRYGHGPCTPQCLVYDSTHHEAVRGIVADTGLVVRDGDEYRVLRAQ